MKLTPRVKMYITFGSMILLAASQISAPINLKGMIPEFFTKSLIGNFSLVSIAAYAVLVSAYWVITRQTA